MVDVIFSDVAQPDQARIVTHNAGFFLKNNGWVMISIKAGSYSLRWKTDLRASKKRRSV